MLDKEISSNNSAPSFTKDMGLWVVPSCAELFKLFTHISNKITESLGDSVFSLYLCPDFQLSRLSVISPRGQAPRTDMMETWSVVLRSCALKPEKFHTKTRRRWQWFTRMRGRIVSISFLVGFLRTSMQGCGLHSPRFLLCASLPWGPPVQPKKTIPKRYYFTYTNN